MKKIQTIYKERKTNNIILSVAYIILLLVFIYMLVINVIFWDFNSLGEFLLSFFNPFLGITISISYATIYFMCSAINSRKNPEKYIAELIDIEECNNDQGTFKLMFKLDIKKTDKVNVNITDNNIECYVNNIDFLEKNANYLVTLLFRGNGLNAIIDNIYEYDAKYKNIRHENKTINLDIVFWMIFICIAFAGIHFILQFIFKIFINNINLYNMLLFNIIIFGFIYVLIYIRRIYIRFKITTDLKKNAKKKEQYDEIVSKLKTNKNYGKSVTILYARKELLYNLLKFLIPVGLGFLAILHADDKYDAFTFIKYILILTICVLFVPAIILIVSYIKNNHSKQKIINRKRNINIEDIAKFNVIKHMNIYYVVDDKNNLLLSARKKDSLKNEYLIGDCNNKLIATITSRSILNDEMIIQRENHKPYICDRLTYPVFHYDVTGIDYKVELTEFLKKYSIRDLNENDIAVFNYVNKENTEWKYLTATEIEFKIDSKEKLDCLLLILAVIFGNIDLVGADNKTLIKENRDSNNISTINSNK